MEPWFTEKFGNPSSGHFYGQMTESAVETARESIGNSFRCDPEEIIFTSGGTEADNLAIQGVVLKSLERGETPHLLISAVEHHAVSMTALAMRRLGAEVEIIPVSSDGMTDPDLIRKKIRRNTVLVSVIFANNEIGTINPVMEIGAICKGAGVLFHTDAVQAAAHLPIRPHQMNVDLFSFGAHKFYGPKGVGGLYARKGIELGGLIFGGSQEHGRRAGTSNVPGIVGMAKALELVMEGMEINNQHVRDLRDELTAQILESIPNTVLTGSQSNRLPNHASFAFAGLESNRLLTALDMAGFACSSGSACKTGDPRPSEVLTEMGYSSEWASGSLRVTLGRETSQHDIAMFTAQLPVTVEKVRRSS